MRTVECAWCRQTFEAKRSDARYCSATCRSRASRASSPADGPQDDGGGLGSTETATMLALAEVGKLGTPSGQAALVLARRIDRPERDTGSSLASMVKRLHETLTELTADVVLKDDPLDELTRRRREKVEGSRQ